MTRIIMRNELVFNKKSETRDWRQLVDRPPEDSWSKSTGDMNYWSNWPGVKSNRIRFLHPNGRTPKKKLSCNLQSFTTLRLILILKHFEQSFMGMKTETKDFGSHPFLPPGSEKILRQTKVNSVKSFGNHGIGSVALKSFTIEPTNVLLFINQNQTLTTSTAISQPIKRFSPGKHINASESELKKLLESVLRAKQKHHQNFIGVALELCVLQAVISAVVTVSVRIIIGTAIIVQVQNNLWMKNLCELKKVDVKYTLGEKQCYRGTVEPTVMSMEEEGRGDANFFAFAQGQGQGNMAGMLGGEGLRMFQNADGDMDGFGFGAGDEEDMEEFEIEEVPDFHPEDELELNDDEDEFPLGYDHGAMGRRTRNIRRVPSISEFPPVDNFYYGEGDEYCGEDDEQLVHGEGLVLNHDMLALVFPQANQPVPIPEEPVAPPLQEDIFLEVDAPFAA